MSCPNCKNEIKDNDTDFCPYCGNYILKKHIRNELKEILDKIFIKKEKKLRKRNKRRNRE